MKACQSYLNNRSKRLLLLGSLLFMALFCAAFSFTGSDDFDQARQQILFRKIGHEVLLYSGDSTSRVLPVQQITENEYQLKFENEFSFQPDSLVKAISSSLANENLGSDYIVSVLNCSSNDVIFGYALFKNAKDDLVPCSGRKQPKGCYVIDLKFKNHGISTSQKGYLIGGIPLLAFIGFVISRKKKSRENVLENGTVYNGVVKMGNTLFDPVKRQLINAGAVTELTFKENKLLLIFARLPDTIIERNRLQKEIWEDEGVIVGRSLDMFISKLRKKLQHDPSIQLMNIHGKGYRLKIEG